MYSTLFQDSEKLYFKIEKDIKFDIYHLCFTKNVILT